MFNDYSRIYVQRKDSIKTARLYYSINSGETVIGNIHEVKKPSGNFKDKAMKLVSLFLLNSPRIIVESLVFHVTAGAEKIGYIQKDAGFYKDLNLYSVDGSLIATVKSTFKVSTPSILVVDQVGDELIKATGGYGATDFNVLDCQTGNQISSIQKRSLVYESIKDNLLEHDVYHIDSSKLSSNVIFALLGAVIALELYFHGGR
ncbi:hypothetical protein [Ornithinibacillus halophilus]|uniref:Uncharacterized protein n=1 Tax=Ornithinibacillus halophilus TaxID=930117 RepID=A0A1M5MP71_9BACI|nr:hypothetical protein [Ornithinibacillus halophilus]SHG79108.1 hypothetical protein SAMN05216225_106219 [Ornithinibacillus halophilus]